MDSNREKIRSSLIRNVRKIVRDEIKQTVKDPEFKKLLYKMLSKVANKTKNLSNERQQKDLPKKHEYCRAKEDLVVTLQKEINDLKIYIMGYEKENQKYKNLVCAYMTTIVEYIEDFDSILSDIGAKRYFQKKFLQELKITTKKKVERQQSKGNKAHKSSPAKNDHVKQKHGDVKNVSPLIISKTEEFKKKMYRKLLKFSTLAKDDINKKHINQLCYYYVNRGNALYSYPTGTAYDIFGNDVNSHQKTISKDELKRRSKFQHLANLVLMKKSEYSMKLNRAGLQVPVFRRPWTPERTLNKLKKKCPDISDKNTNFSGEIGKGKNLE